MEEHIEGKGIMDTYDAHSEAADLISQSKQLRERAQILRAEHQALSVEFDLLSPEGKCTCQPPTPPATPEQ